MAVMRVKRFVCLLLFLALAGVPGAGRAVTNVFDYPLVFRQHQALVQEMQQAMRRHDAAGMESICRAGASLLP